MRELHDIALSILAIMHYNCRGKEDKVTTAPALFHYSRRSVLYISALRTKFGLQAVISKILRAFMNNHDSHRNMVAQPARSSQTLLQFHFSRDIIKWVTKRNPLVCPASLHLAESNLYLIL